MQRRRLLLILAAVVRPGDVHFRLIKYSQFPPLSLLTIAGLTPDGWEITVRDEHVESSAVDDDVDLVGIQTYISSAGRAYELAQRWRRRGAKVVLGGLHPTSMPYEAAEHADAVCIGPAETVCRYGCWQADNANRQEGGGGCQRRGGQERFRP
jgi:radical SAM superfamily enzyme YgiQ (UPF0313 family)